MEKCLLGWGYPVSKKNGILHLDDRYRVYISMFLMNYYVFPAAPTRPHRLYTLVSANDVLLDSSVSKYNPSDCQRPEVLNKKLVEGNILLCGYSFNFVVGTASIKKVVATAKHLGAAGFVLVVENVSPGTKFDPVPSAIPGILITDVSKSMVMGVSIAFTYSQPNFSI